MCGAVKSVLLIALALSACADDPEPAPLEPLFPPDFETAWQEARSCRFSHDHDLRTVRVFADLAAYGPYLDWTGPFPVGATLVKIEYDDATCGTVLGFTAMQKLPAGSAPEARDWAWQRLDASKRVISSDDVPARCVDCHEYHCREPYGWDWTCGKDLPF